MKKEFIIERQGKNFILFAGLLDRAHEKGLTSILTHIVQIPDESNNRVAICAATVTLEREGKTLCFTGIGDAAPNNVAPAMQTCLIRMAETRAKARALRDAVNVGAASLEELGEGLTGNDADDYPPQGRTGQRSARAGTGAGAAPRPKADPTGPITDDQRRAILTLCNKRGVQPPELDGWNQQQAGEYLRELQKQAA